MADKPEQQVTNNNDSTPEVAESNPGAAAAEAARTELQRESIDERFGGAKDDRTDSTGTEKPAVGDQLTDSATTPGTDNLLDPNNQSPEARAYRGESGDAGGVTNPYDATGDDGDGNVEGDEALRDAESGLTAEARARRAERGADPDSTDELPSELDMAERGPNDPYEDELAALQLDEGDESAPEAPGDGPEGAPEQDSETGDTNADDSPEALNTPDQNPTAEVTGDTGDTADQGPNDTIVQQKDNLHKEGESTVADKDATEDKEVEGDDSESNPSGGKPGTSEEARDEDEKAAALHGHAVANAGAAEAASPEAAAAGAPEAHSRDAADASGEAGGEVGQEGSDHSPDAGDKPSAERTEQAIKDYTETLQGLGLSEQEAADVAKTTFDRLSKLEGEGHLKGSAVEQLERTNKAIGEVADGSGPLGQDMRRDTALGMAYDMADPNKYANQGKHNSCALHSNYKQNLQGGDPAAQMEAMRDLANTGKATFIEQTPNGPKSRTVEIDAANFQPDGESRQPFSKDTHGTKGARHMAGQLADAMYGQMSADLRFEREQAAGTLPEGTTGYTYVTANADALGARPGQSRTGEGLFRDSAAGHQFIGGSPEVNIWDVAHLNHAMGGETGAVFAHENLVGKNGTPPDGYPDHLRITTFNEGNIKQKLGEFQDKTGQMAQIGVNAPYLRGGGMSGHGMHAMNAGLDENGNIVMDNNWGSEHDLANVSAAELDLAANPEEWKNQGGGAGGGSGPEWQRKFGPGDGRNPNETEADFEKRRKEEDEAKEKESDKDKHEDEKGEKTDEQASDAQRQAAIAEFTQAQADYAARKAAATAAGQSFYEAPPSLQSYLQRAGAN